MVLFQLDHLVTANDGEVTSLLLDGLIDPGALVNSASVEVSHLQLGVARLDLVGETLVLVDQHSSMTLNLVFDLIVDVTTLRNEEH